MPLNLSPSQVAFNARGDGQFNRPFKEQVDFFRQKLNLPTEHWDDILASAHDRAFVVAGAMKGDLLADLRSAVDKAISDGKSIDWFKKEFEGIVKKNGWEGWTGSDTASGRDWRSRLIYRTNLSASYAAGRYQQLMHPDLLKIYPYWKYVHNDSVSRPRPLHQSWSGTVLRYDDPWWDTHFCPNGWGCRCRITAVGEKEFTGQAAPDDGMTEVKDRWGDMHETPAGVDYGWGYKPGASLLPKQLSAQAMDMWRASKADAWETLTPRHWQDYGRPELIPLHTTNIKPGLRVHTADEVVSILTKQFGGESKVFSVGSEFKYPVMVNAAVLGEHIDPARSEYLPYFDELLSDPFEVWAMFQRHKGTGKTEMRIRVIKRIDTGNKEGMMLVAQANRGQLEAWTFIPVDNLKYLNKQRMGILIYGQ